MENLFHLLDAMIHVFNCPIDPSTLGEFQRGRSPAPEEEVFEEKSKVEKSVVYQRDGRRIVDGKIETEQSAEEAWRAAIKSGAILGWKKKCDIMILSSPNDIENNEDENDSGRDDKYSRMEKERLKMPTVAGTQLRRTASAKFKVALKKLRRLNSKE
ncbi:unnamed protein product [Enterobius vermicularis]|uniref:Uncharacterized protein n=1 Tax=Enterobius vermicularis TaxID=51028 RepID=A0A0N4UZM8_ENTVE|nr:unnamed protein product [Enterobius vermicularis]